MSDEYEIANLRNKLDDVLDPNYPNREEVLDVFAEKLHISNKAVEDLRDEFFRLYTGEKDKVEEFKLLVSATSLLQSGKSAEYVREKINKFLDLIDGVQEVAEEDEYSPTYDALPPVDWKPGGEAKIELKPLDEILQDRLRDLGLLGKWPVEFNPPFLDIWGYRQDRGLEQLPVQMLRGLKPGINVKVSTVGESFFCEIIAQLTSENYLCRVNNELMNTNGELAQPGHGLKLHDKVIVNARQIKDVSW